MKGRIVINRDYCKGCDYCSVACPQKIIMLDTKFNSTGFFPATIVNMYKCTGCAMCAIACPEIAIEVWRSEEGDGAN
ncbi:MAG: ferredoxin family protein [Nitrospirae bacterium]|nr:ferredoxin family protein [Nitrospirota bacterium]